MEAKCEFVEESEGYTCKVYSPEITKPKQKIKSIFGTHKTGKANADVTIISFESTTHFIPRGLDVFFPNVKELIINKRGLQSICRDDLSQFKNLEILDLGNNQLTALPDDLFEDTPKLLWIRFYGNKIKFASSNLFKPIIDNNFEYICFSENPNIDLLYYQRGSTGIVESVTEFMKIIDSSFKKPLVDPRLSFEHFSDKLSADHNEKSIKKFEDLLVSGKFSDFVVVVKSKRFNVHRNILATQSEGFAEMFEKDPRAETSIDDLSPETVEEFLRYLYTGKLQDLADKSLEMFVLASRIKVGNFKESIEEFLAANLNESNAFKAFTIAHSYKSEKLKTAAFKEIQKMFPDKTMPESWMDDLEKVEKMIEMKEKFDKMFVDLQNQ